MRIFWLKFRVWEEIVNCVPVAQLQNAESI